MEQNDQTKETSLAEETRESLVGSSNANEHQPIENTETLSQTELSEQKEDFVPELTTNEIPTENLTEKDIRDILHKNNVMGALENLMQEINEKRPKKATKWLGISFLKYYVNNVLEEGEKRNALILKWRPQFDLLPELEAEKNQELLESPPTSYLEHAVVPQLLEALCKFLSEGQQKGIEYLADFLVQMDVLEKTEQIEKTEKETNNAIESSAPAA